MLPCGSGNFKRPKADYLGYSDDVYCECVTTISQFDVILQVLLVNQTTKVLQNMTVEFQTLGDLKLVERPAPHTLGPHGFHQIKATIKVSSTEVRFPSLDCMC